MSERKATTIKKKLLDEIEHAPEPVLHELLDYARFLRARRETAGLELALVSESVLARDWLSPEEDEAWGDL